MWRALKRTDLCTAWIRTPSVTRVRHYEPTLKKKELLKEKDLKGNAVFEVDTV